MVSYVKYPPSYGRTMDTGDYIYVVTHPSETIHVPVAAFTEERKCKAFLADLDYAYRVHRYHDGRRFPVDVTSSFRMHS